MTALSVSSSGERCRCAAIACQRRWRLRLADGVEIRVRIAIHTGEAELRDGDYFGPTVNRTARLRATAHGGQIVSRRRGSRPRPAADGIALTDLGVHRLPDLGRPETVCGLVHPELPSTFPPLRSIDAFPRQPAGSADELRRPRARNQIDSRGIRFLEVDHPDRYGWRGQDPSRSAGRRGHVGVVFRRSLAVRACRRFRPGVDAASVGRQPGYVGGNRSPDTVKTLPSTSALVACSCCWTTASTCSTRLLNWSTDFWLGARTCACSPPAGKRLTCRVNRSSVCVHWSCPTRMWRWMTSYESMRQGFSWSEPEPSIHNCVSNRPTRSRSPRSVGGSTAFHLPSSWLPLASWR